jgi:hypothetical protein
VEDPNLVDADVYLDAVANERVRDAVSDRVHVE